MEKFNFEGLESSRIEHNIDKILDKVGEKLQKLTAENAHLRRLLQEKERELEAVKASRGDVEHLKEENKYLRMQLEEVKMENEHLKKILTRMEVKIREIVEKLELIE